MKVAIGVEKLNFNSGAPARAEHPTLENTVTHRVDFSLMLTPLPSTTTTY